MSSIALRVIGGALLGSVIAALVSAQRPETAPAKEQIAEWIKGLGDKGNDQQRAVKEQADMRRHMDAYVRETAGSSPVDELHKLSELKQRGDLSDEEFERAKAKLILIGDEMVPLDEALDGSVAVDRVSTVAEATDRLRHVVHPGDAVLVKASNSVGLAKLVESMAKEPACST